MSYKFFYLYLVGGIVFLVMLIYQLIVYYPLLNIPGVILDTFIVLLLFYMAYKVRREKEDKDLM
jgi:predicted membrane-bound dolichyl-phosphate-mannose-protein mannosyltransferase